MESMDLFECKQLYKRYPKGNFTLEDINLKLKTGHITGVVGENGNGKTTLLRIIAGELAHDSGDIKYFGHNNVEVLTWENIRSRVAYIPQRIPKWYGVLRANLVFEASIRGIKGKTADLLIDSLLEKLHLTEYADLQWKEISTGYRLRFQLAKMLIGSPELLVLDEPIANLDINAQEKFLSDLRNIVSEPGRNVSVILSSQQLHEIENVSDSIVFLRQGKMIYSGGVAEIGAERENNEFEMQISLSSEEVQSIFPEAEVKVAGKTLHIKTDLNLTAEEFIRKILDANGKILYFRDISSSTKRLFNN